MPAMSLDGKARGAPGKGFLFHRKERKGKERKREEGRGRRKDRTLFCWAFIFGCGTQAILLPKEKQG